MDELNITIREDIVDYCIPVWLIYFNGVYQTIATSEHNALYFKYKAAELFERGLNDPSFKTTREYRRYFE